MAEQFIWLYYLSSVTGLIMVVGGIFLLYKEKIYIDSQTNEVTSLETPIGKFRTNAPALALFLIGFIPLIYPIYQSSKKEDKVKLQGKVSGSKYPIQVYVVLDSESVNNEREYSFKVPAHAEQEQYTVLYRMDNIIMEERADLDKVKDGRIEIDALNMQGRIAEASYQPQVDKVPDEFQ
jgi:hypothetical protein